MEDFKTGKKRCLAALGDYKPIVDSALRLMRDDRIIERILKRDHTVWKEDPREIGNRLGWLHSPVAMVDAIPAISSFADQVREERFTHALLLGMGGSSLAPEMFRNIFSVKTGYLELSVLDSTDPGAVLFHARNLNPERTLYIVSTKSGGTVETISFMKFFYNHVVDSIGLKGAGKHFIAITDPGSGLETSARELEFRKIFLNDPDIGGRYSALSYFGLVPAALIGMDLSVLLERAATAIRSCAHEDGYAEGGDSGAWLGTTMGQLALKGRDKLTLIASEPISHFCVWLEQLVAESTGKEGKGIVPIEGESLAAPDTYSNDRFFVHLRLNGDSTYDAQIEELARSGHPIVQINIHDRYDLGSEIFRWEMATAIAGMHLGINPFDQPNVESAKVRAREMVTAYKKEGRLPDLTPSLKENGIDVYASFSASTMNEAWKKFFSQARQGENETAGRSYVAFQAYLQPTAETSAALQTLRNKVQLRYRMATMVGYGPRFLHSTGQLHKGDAGHGLFIQLTSENPDDAPIPDTAGSKASSMTFGILKMAQALGDRQALLDAGRSVIRFHLGSDVMRNLKKLSEVAGE